MDESMKAMEAPEKIYLQVCGDCPQTDCDNCKFEDLENNITWCKDKIFKKDIEYIQTDAFIEKAAKWLEDNAIEYWGTEAVDNGMMIDDFKKAMKL